MSAEVIKLKPGEILHVSDVGISRVYFGSDAEKTILEIARLEQAAGAMVSITQGYESGRGHWTQVEIRRVNAIPVSVDVSPAPDPHRRAG